jgi:uracil-DNA glycosylase
MAKETASIEFLDEQYDWKTLTLWDYILEGNYPRSWINFFHDDGVQKELVKISEELQKEVDEGVTIYPPINQVFRAFCCTPLHKTKVVILGMDPYHNPGAAVGLCFSVRPGNKINPSLRNIYRELKSEGYSPTEDGVLTHWADQGCLMLNTALTVAKGEADSHTGIWYKFSEKVIKYIAYNYPSIVWLLMGSKALAFQPLLGDSKVVITSHPSPFSAYKGFREHPSFLGSDAFRKINDQLKKPIDW